MKKYTDEEIARMIEKQEKAEARQKKQTRRQWAKMKIMKRKIEELGVVVTDEEIDAEILLIKEK